MIEVKFLMDFTPNEEGKLSSEIMFALPEHPEVELPKSLREVALKQVGVLCWEVLAAGLPGD